MGTRILWFRFWIPPERPLPVTLDKGNAGSGNEFAPWVNKVQLKEKRLYPGLSPRYPANLVSRFSFAPEGRVGENPENEVGVPHMCLARVNQALVL